MPTSFDDLLARWHEAHERGAPLTPEELCRDCPQHLDELRRRVAGDLPTLAEGAATLPPAGGGPAGLPSLPGYELLSELGRGGMGVVYKARQTKLKRVVAVKMLLTGARASPAELARFRIEAEAAAHLRHPNIVQVYDVGEHDGCPYIAMEYVEGGGLDRRLRDGPLPPAEAARLVETVARAIHTAHRAGIVHRDLKPANVLLRTAEDRGQKSEVRSQKSEDEARTSDHCLLTSDLCPLISDFGLAKRLDSLEDHTRTGAVMGTPGYMAPEQVGGRKGDIGPATDVWALGAILYECLTGRPPFRAETPIDICLLVMDAEPPRPRALNPAVPRDLETVVLKCLDKDPKRRYASAADLADDLARFLDGRPVLARPVGRTTLLLRRCRRHPVTAGLAVVAAGLLLTLLGLAVARRDDSLRRVKRAGKLVVVTDRSYPPMEFFRGGELVGFDVDLGRALAARLGVTAEFVPIDWDWEAARAGLAARRYDAAIATLNITKERREQVEFVQYSQVRLMYVCRQGKEVRREADLAGKAVAVQRHTPGEKLVLRARREGVRIGSVLTVQTSEALVDAVLGGKADVILLDEPVALHYAGLNPDVITVTAPVGDQDDPDPIGIALRKGANKLHEALERALLELREDGTIAELRAKWFKR